MLQLNFCTNCGEKRVRDVKQELEKLLSVVSTYKSDLCAICLRTLKKNQRKSPGRVVKKLTLEDEEAASQSDGETGVLKTAKDVEPFIGHVEPVVKEEIDDAVIETDKTASSDDNEEVESGCEEGSKTKGMKCDYESVTADLDPRLLEFITKSDDSKQPFECTVCLKKFSYVNSFSRHIGKHHGAETIDKPFKCQLCEARFTRRYNLQTHGRKHSDERPFKCSFPPCTAMFKDKHTLAGHEETHTGKEKPHQCEYCSKSFNKKATLVRHKRVHTGDKPYLCKFCGFSCTQKQNLAIHERQHTEEKPYRCEICDRGFYQWIQLQNHKLDHTGARPYVCDICGHSCKAKSYLKQHMSIHKSERPYKCDLCNFTSKRKENIRSHQVVHTTERSFQCSQCMKRFKRKDTMMKHERRYCRDGARGSVQVKKQRKKKQILFADSKREETLEIQTAVQTANNIHLAKGEIATAVERLEHQDGRILNPPPHPPHHHGYSSGFHVMGLIPHHVTPHVVTQTSSGTHEYEPVDVVFNVL